MGTRSEAIDWLHAKQGTLQETVCTSKLFQAKESWTKRKTWWIRVPLRHINSKSDIHFLCHAAGSKSSFYHLVVPPSHLRSHLKQFHILSETINLHLSAEPENMFVDERGKGQVSFKDYLSLK